MKRVAQRPSTHPHSVKPNKQKTCDKEIFKKYFCNSATENFQRMQSEIPTKATAAHTKTTAVTGTVTYSRE